MVALNLMIYGPGRAATFNRLFGIDLPGSNDQITVYHFNLNEEGAASVIAVIDTADTSNTIDSKQNSMLLYLDEQFCSYQAELAKIRRNPRFEDTKVHALLYFIAPIGDRLNEMDVELMKRLCSRVNVIPIIGQAETVSPMELSEFKKLVMEALELHNIPVYNFPNDPEDDQATMEENDALRALLPFALNESGETDDDDSAKFRMVFLKSHWKNLREITENSKYENYYQECLDNTYKTEE